MIHGLNALAKLRRDFIMKDKKIPNYIFMSRECLQELADTIEDHEIEVMQRNNAYYKAAKDLFPRRTQFGDKIFGMEIVEALTDEPYLR